MKTRYKIILLFLLIGFHLLDEVSAQQVKTVLQLNPGENNPRNSEGDFVRLKDGRIMFIYTHFTGKSE